MSNLLRLHLEPDSDGTCELFAQLTAGEFSGAASAWFGLSELADFGRSVRDTFPLRADQRLKLEGGFWSNMGASVLEELHLGIHVYPLGDTGSIGVHVQLATAEHSGERKDARCSVQVEFRTSYENLRGFGQAVVALTHGSAKLAVLHGQ
jgi:hypothetical protein